VAVWLSPATFVVTNSASLFSYYLGSQIVEPTGEMTGHSLERKPGREAHTSVLSRMGIAQAKTSGIVLF
jgi:hypothetical protein